MRAADLRTPALRVDLDAMESNLRTMAEYFGHRSAKLRPHFKGHQVLAIANRQLESGAIGMTCARLEHAEQLVRHGIKDVLVASEIGGKNLIRRFVELSQHQQVIVAVDNAEVISEMAARAANRARTLNVMVDLDVGLGRCGVASPEAALFLTKLVLRKGMSFRGLMGYGGSNRLPHGPEKERVARAMVAPLLQAKLLLEAAGIAVGIVSCGCTADYTIMASIPGITEIQTGAYLLMDTGHNRFAPEFQRTLSVQATVISKTGNERVVVDAGLKSMGLNPLLPQMKSSGLRVRALHAEHAILEVTESVSPLNIGDKVEIWVEYLDSALGLHQRMYGIRGQEVESIYSIEP